MKAPKRFGKLSEETFAVLIEKYSAGSPLDQAFRKIDLRLLVAVDSRLLRAA